MRSKAVRGSDFFLSPSIVSDQALPFVAGLFQCFTLMVGTLKDNNKLVHVHNKQRASHNHVRDLQHCKRVRSFCVGQDLVVRTCAARALYQLRLGITPLVGDYSPSAAQARPHKLQSLINFLSCLIKAVYPFVCLSGKSRSV